MAQLQDTELPEGDAEHTLHLNPAADFHPRVLLPGDPARAMAIATSNLTEPRMFNHRRGLWGYSGRTENGVGLTIQSSGMGGPSAAIVVEELCDLGAEVIVRVGTCGALAPGIELGDMIVATSAIGMDGTSRALGAEDRQQADPVLSELLAKHATRTDQQFHRGAIATVDLFYDPAAQARHETISERGALGLEMEAAAVFAVARRRGVRAACLLGVSDLLGGDDQRARLPHDEITELGAAIGRVAVKAVAELAND
jgi:DeoD family purine-nucleoside phosphorylase